jgi:FkbM family methyltransferase
MGSKAVRQVVRKLLSRTRWGRERRAKDPFFVTQKLVRVPAPLILDVGAHVGESATRYRALFPGATIHSFEPFSESYEALCATCQGDERIVPHRAAVADSTGSATLHVNRASVTNSLLASDRRGDNYWGAGLLDTEGDVTVATVALDDFCKAEGIEHVDVLKIDVQGAEYAVLAGARSLLSRHAIDVMLLELIIAPSYVGQRKYYEYLASMDELGYVLFDLFWLGRHAGRLVQSDALFLSPAVLERYEREQSGVPR